MLERENAPEVLNPRKSPNSISPKSPPLSLLFSSNLSSLSLLPFFQWKTNRLVVWLLLIITLIHPSGAYLQFSPNQFYSFRQSKSLYRGLQCNNDFGWSVKLINLLQAELMAYVSSICLPFIIMGDFNEIGSHFDKEGGAEFDHSRLVILSQLYSQISCVDVPFSGSRFTWRKKRQVLIIFLKGWIGW